VPKRPRLTLLRLVDGALEVARELGADRMTMKDVARHLGVGTMSLYYYVPDKAALLTQMAGELYARVEVPPAHAPWEDRLRSLLTQVYRGFLRVPGLDPIVQFGEPALTHYRRVADAVHVALAESGMAHGDAVRSTLILTGYAATRGAATASVLHLLRSAERAAERTGDEADGGAPSPLAHGVAAEAEAVPADELFGFGLDLLLAGARSRAGGAR
jgi:AcrR family transcriptional regulator